MGTTRTFGGHRSLLALLSCLGIGSVSGLSGCGATAAVDLTDGGDDAGVDAGPQEQQPTPITLVEVFGAEGCAKCPAADISTNAFATQGTDGIFSIEYHVSYSPPWKDVYASSTYDTLAGSYLTPIFGSSGFTYPLPALFINSAYIADKNYPYTNEFKGIPKDKVTPQATIALSLHSASTATPLVVNYDVTILPGGPTSGMLSLVLVERGIVSRITSGDNAGINLHEENVARAFASKTTGNSQGFLKLDVPADVDRTNSSVIAFYKDDTYQTLYGASELDL